MKITNDGSSGSRADRGAFGDTTHALAYEPSGSTLPPALPPYPLPYGCGAPREPFTDKNSLILQTVSKQGDDYVAENSSAKTGTTRYRVSTARLEIDLPDGTVQREQVVAHDP